MVSDPGNSGSVAGSADSIDLLKISTSGSSNSNVVKTSNGVSSNDDDDMSIEDDDGDDNNEYDYDDNDDNDDNDGFLYDDDDYMTLQSHFDNVNLPPGVEAPLPWLNDPSPSENLASTKTLTISDLPPCSSTVPSESSSSTKPADSIDDCIIQNSQQFKQFDIVEDFSDHHYSRMGFSDEQVSLIT